nr:NADH dehydrogenase subunit 2 [Wallacea dactyliferae]
MTNFYKIMFFNLLIISTLIVISSYSWFSVWMGLEMNLVAMIPLIFKNKNIITTEAAFKYFMIQSIASSILLLSFISSENFFNSNLDWINSFNLLLLESSLLMKLGMAPFHSWFPEVSQGIDWMSCLILFTWQKIAPMTLLSLISKFSNIIILTLIISSIVSGIGGINQNSIRKILAYSSINHMTWMLMSMQSKLMIWFNYWTIYTMMNIFIVKLLEKSQILYLTQINQMNMKLMLKLLLFLNLISMGGIPPMIGFLPKWLVISWLMNSESFLIPFIIIIFTLIPIFFYLQISFSTLMLKSTKTKLNLMNHSTSMAMLNFLFLFSLPLMMMMF